MPEQSTHIRVHQSTAANLVTVAERMAKSASAGRLEGVQLRETGPKSTGSLVSMDAVICYLITQYWNHVARSDKASRKRSRKRQEVRLPG